MTFSGWLKDYNQAERLLWQNPQDVLSRLNLKAGDVFMDIGCGDGFFALPAAMQVGSAGRVYGLDVSPEALANMQTRAEEAGLTNINPVLGKMMIETARKAKIPYQVEPCPRSTGTDANAIQVTRAGVAAGLVSIPNRYMHTPVEVVSLCDLENAARLIAAVVQKIDAGTDFTPM